LFGGFFGLDKNEVIIIGRIIFEFFWEQRLEVAASFEELTEEGPRVLAERSRINWAA
jgi:hypothetical protein